MTLEELQAMSADDLKMDNLELGDESLRSAQLHQKYLTIYNNFRQLVLMNEGTYNVLKRKKWEYTVVDRKSTRLNSSHGYISYAVFCLKKKKIHQLK